MTGLHAATPAWKAFFTDIIAPLKPGADGRITSAPAWAYLLATISWIVTMLRQLPCRYVDASSNPDRFGWMCYSDITSLYFSRGQATGALPYASAQWEYPVLTGYFAGLANGLGRLFGANTTEGISGQQMVDNMNIYFAINAVGLFICLLWMIRSLLKLAPNSPGLAMLAAIAPAVWTTGLINWDLLPVALVMAGLVAWKNDKTAQAGILWGLGVAAKLYPIVIIGALVVVCLRRDNRHSLAELKKWAIMAGSAAATWLLVNIPVMVAQWDGWATFYTYNSGRGADLGSLWYSLSLAGFDTGHPIVWSRLLMIVAYLGLAILIFAAPAAPSPEQIAFLAVVIMIVGNLVYSPQYVLWLLPLLVLVRPKILDLSVFSVAELIYFVAIWLFLHGNDLTMGLGAAPWFYIIAIWIRLAATIWISVRVIRDVMSVPRSATPTGARPARWGAWAEPKVGSHAAAAAPDEVLVRQPVVVREQ
ncbi:MAG: glycosyltransferase 87 family protein [Propionibacteriaceae bacterium]|jgi:hypothetical protein|nr:glycosyltransferase 87 family protein [Propionibacteriaceae bacterium]